MNAQLSCTNLWNIQLCVKCDWCVDESKGYEVLLQFNHVMHYLTAYYFVRFCWRRALIVFHYRPCTLFEKHSLHIFKWFSLSLKSKSSHFKGTRHRTVSWIFMRTVFLSSAVEKTRTPKKTVSASIDFYTWRLGGAMNWEWDTGTVELQSREQEIMRDGKNKQKHSVKVWCLW